MVSSARVTSLISPNGLGHYRRSIGVLDRVCERLPDLSITVLCEDSQVERASFWDRSRSFWKRPNVRRVSGILPGVTWPLAIDGDLVRWVDRLADVPELAAADLVLSDNLAGVLQLRPDAVLLGSFLWSDVLAAGYPDNTSVRTFVEHERALLAARRPTMLCVGDIAMPGVLERTNAVRLPWMCEADTQEAVHGPRKRVAVIGGATGAADALLSRIVRALVGHGAWEIASSPHLGAPNAFGFSPGELAALDAVVCRPGVGTITDCISQRVPMVVVSESDNNVELAHNGQRLAALGVARDLGPEPADRDVVRAVAEILGGADTQMRERLASLACNGLAEAAEFLVARLARAGVQ